MSKPFDPYLQWLAIRDPQRPPNHYRLLGVAMYESDPHVLANAADRQMLYVRTFQTGKHSAQSQLLLNELSVAKVCLLNPEKKAAYDAELHAAGRRRGRADADRTVESAAGHATQFPYDMVCRGVGCGRTLVGRLDLAAAELSSIARGVV